ncbi:hypothetical protein LshimejAT787_0212130 [Lyophyllum shimeji]|uniref:Uncharacterized protein n=1 Tax=Lyophyllum shimeji TaxID=47721 RepID=A0A9P3UJF6_LYOSH|nr:hypothetical protein LshimejAT787_0212130 [Lyophyllum shimeji]
MSTEGETRKKVFLVDWELKSAARVDPSIKTTARPSKLHRALEQLQAKLREQQRSDPPSPSRTYSTSARRSSSSSAFSSSACSCLAILVADLSDAGGKAELFAALALSRRVSLAGCSCYGGNLGDGELGTSFCEMDLSERAGRGCERGEE